MNRGGNNAISEPPIRNYFRARCFCHPYEYWAAQTQQPTTHAHEGFCGIGTSAVAGFEGPAVLTPHWLLSVNDIQDLRRNDGIQYFA